VDVLVPGLVVRVDEAVTEEELRHGVGLQGHVERRARLLALKQVRVVTHLHTHTRTHTHTHTHTHTVSVPRRYQTGITLVLLL